MNQDKNELQISNVHYIHRCLIIIIIRHIFVILSDTLDMKVSLYMKHHQLLCRVYPFPPGVHKLGVIPVTPHGHDLHMGLLF